MIEIHELLGKGRHKKVYRATVDGVEMAATPNPPWNRIVDHDKEHVIKYLPVDDGWYFMELGIPLTHTLEHELFSALPNRELFTLIMQQKIQSCFELTDLKLTSYDEQAEFVIVPSDDYKLKRIDVDYPNRNETQEEILRDNLYITLATSYYPEGVFKPFRGGGADPLPYVQEFAAWCQPCDNIIKDYFTRPNHANPRRRQTGE